jgi:diaminopimelate epimerase
MRFTKMHGAGNDYVYVNGFDQVIPDEPGELAVRVSDRRFGVGSDGLILILPSKVADARMQMFNADGSESAMCGNGIRCVAKYVYDHGLCRNEKLKIETGAGVLSVDLCLKDGLVDSVTVDMGQPILEAARVPTLLAEQTVVNFPMTIDGHRLFVTCLSMGNPHCVIFVPEATDELVLQVGPKIEKDPRFPQRTNVEFVEILSPREVNQRTWERGSGETWACGTGASAVCVAGVLTGQTDREILNHLRGGDLRLRWEEATNHVFMTGPAVEVFHGEWPLA